MKLCKKIVLVFVLGWLTINLGDLKSWSCRPEKRQNFRANPMYLA